MSATATREERIRVPVRFPFQLIRAGHCIVVTDLERGPYLRVAAKRFGDSTGTPLSVRKTLDQDGVTEVLVVMLRSDVDAGVEWPAVAARL